MVKWLLFLTVFLTGTIAGLHTGSMFFFNPAVDALPLREQLLSLKEMERVFNPAIPVLMATMGILSFILPFFLKRGTILFYCSVVAAVGLLIQTLTTLVINVPINNLVAQMDLTAIPADWGEIRARWNTFNVLRTVLLNAAFMAYLYGLITLFHQKKSVQ